MRLPLLDPEAADGLRSADVLPILGCDAETGLSNSLIVLLTRSSEPSRQRRRSRQRTGAASYAPALPRHRRQPRPPPRGTAEKADNGSTAFSLRFEGDRPASSLLLPASSLSVADGTGKDVSPGESDAAPSFA